MKKHMMTTVAATAAVAAMALGSAAPAMATKSGLVATPGSDDMSWVMPDLDGVVLKHAILTVEDVTAPVVVNIGTVDDGPPAGDQPGGLGGVRAVPESGRQDLTRNP